MLKTVATNVYKEEELKNLHHCLFEILSEFVRVCNELGLNYFLIGGSAIGAFFWENIIPWDDDIDVGMTRDDYERFLKEAPHIMNNKYFLQWQGSDKHSPFCFAKIRKNNTCFIEGNWQGIKMHHGIYVDIFPLDKVPNNYFLEKVQRKMVVFLNECLMAKERWLYKYFGKCEIEKPLKHNFLNCLMNRLVISLLPKRTIFWMQTKISSFFNRCETEYYNILIFKRDHIKVESIKHLQLVKFGDMELKAPSDLESYLRHHYPNLQKLPPKSERENHAPLELSF